MVVSRSQRFVHGCCHNVLKPLDKLDLIEGEEVDIELKKRSLFGLLKNWKIDSHIRNTWGDNSEIAHRICCQRNKRGSFGFLKLRQKRCIAERHNNCGNWAATEDGL